MTIRQDYPRGQERAAWRGGDWGWITAAIVAAVILGGVGAYSTTGERKSTAAQTERVTSGQNSVPSTADGANKSLDRDAPANNQNQPSPQGPTGPLNTTSGGAPASTPQGEAPPGMQ